jgi:hypothetical protein
MLTPACCGGGVRVLFTAVGLPPGVSARCSRARGGSCAAGYPLDEITGSVLVLVTGLAAALDRLMGIQGERVSLPLPAL